MTQPTDPLYQLPYTAECARKVRRAVTVAGVNAWSFTVFAVASAVLLVLCTLSGDFTLAALGITVALGMVAYYEFRGKQMLTQLDVAGCRVLGWNQLGLLAALSVYCGWSIVWGFLYPSNLVAGLEEHPELLASFSELERRDLMEMAGILDEFWPVIIAATYGAIIIASLIYQGGNAWYYFTRKRYVEECQGKLTP